MPNAKCALEDDFQDVRHLGDVDEYDSESKHKVNHSHSRHNSRREPRHAVDSAKDDEEGHERQHQPHYGRLNVECLLPCGAYRVALDGALRIGEREHHQHGKDGSHPRLFESVFHVIGRSAIERAVALAFIQLRERRFYKRDG